MKTFLRICATLMILASVCDAHAEEKKEGVPPPPANALPPADAPMHLQLSDDLHPNIISYKESVEAAQKLQLELSIIQSGQETLRQIESFQHLGRTEYQTLPGSPSEISTDFPQIQNETEEAMVPQKDPDEPDYPMQLSEFDQPYRDGDSVQEKMAYDRKEHRVRAPTKDDPTTRTTN